MKEMHWLMLVVVLAGHGETRRSMTRTTTRQRRCQTTTWLLRSAGRQSLPSSADGTARARIRRRRRLQWLEAEFSRLRRQYIIVFITHHASQQASPRSSSGGSHSFLCRSAVALLRVEATSLTIHLSEEWHCVSRSHSCAPRRAPACCFAHRRRWHPHPHPHPHPLSTHRVPTPARCCATRSVAASPLAARPPAAGTSTAAAQ